MRTLLLALLYAGGSAMEPAPAPEPPAPAPEANEPAPEQPSIVDLSSLAWHFRFNNVALGQNQNLVRPTNIESVISRLAVEVNGQTLVNMNN
eukprot:SAG22_NODE_655_length_8104_cov_6.498438_1_plen_92_part_00